MKPSDLVPDLDTCQRLKEAGFEQDTVLSYYDQDYDIWWTTSGPLRIEGILCAAPTLQEILNMLGVFINPMPPMPSLRAVTRIIDAKNSSQEAALLWLELNEESDETT